MLKRFYKVFVLLLFLPLAAQGASLIDINTAPSEELEKIIGIGPALSQRIIEARPFNSLDDLIKVKGIGEKTLQKIKNQGLARVSSQGKLKPEPDSKKSEDGFLSNKLISQKETAAIKSKTPQSDDYSFPLIIVFVIALSSAVIILILKKSLSSRIGD